MPLKSRISSRNRLWLIMGFLLAFFAVQNLTTYTLYRRAKSQLDNGLGQSLEAVALQISRTIEFTGADSLTLDRFPDNLYGAILTAQADNALSNVVVLKPDGRTIVDTEGFSQPGEPNPFIALDFSAVTLARSGITAQTQLYKTGDVYMKSAYAPVTGRDGSIIALVGVEAGAGFFDDLRALANLLILVSLIGAVAVTVLGLLFYRQSVSLDKAQEAVIQKENLSTLGRMVANIAHEIRNPLSIISTSAQRIRRKHKIDDEALDFITEEVDELNQILTGYLQFAGGHSPEFHAVVVNDVVQRCVRVAGADAQTRGVTLVHDLQDDVRVQGDERRIRQALLNVIINAIQASPEGGTVEIKASMNGHKASVAIRDSGAGIDGKTIEQIRQPFFTSKVDGSGLGLSVVDAVMKEHGGEMHIDSNVGSGTRVVLEFPAKQRGSA